MKKLENLSSSTREVQAEFKTTQGPLYIVADDRNLLGIHFTKQKEIPLILVNGLPPKDPLRNNFEKIFSELGRYLRGKKFDMTLQLKFRGTEFQKKVWRALQEIPYGHTISYKDLAKRVGRPKAYRAVGTANGKNPIALVIPCHRVIAADGSIGGYGGGLRWKRFLLNLENIKSP